MSDQEQEQIDEMEEEVFGQFEIMDAHLEKEIETCST